MASATGLLDERVQNHIDIEILLTQNWFPDAHTLIPFFKKQDVLIEEAIRTSDEACMHRLQYGMRATALLMYSTNGS